MTLHSTLPRSVLSPRPLEFNSAGVSSSWFFRLRHPGISFIGYYYVLLLCVYLCSYHNSTMSKSYAMPKQNKTDFIVSSLPFIILMILSYLSEHVLQLRILSGIHKIFMSKLMGNASLKFYGLWVQCRSLHSSSKQIINHEVS